MASVELRGVRMTYGRLTVADAIDLKIEYGELLACLALSAAAKRPRCD